MGRGGQLPHGGSFTSSWLPLKAEALPGDSAGQVEIPALGQQARQALDNGSVVELHQTGE